MIVCFPPIADIQVEGLLSTIAGVTPVGFGRLRRSPNFSRMDDVPPKGEIFPVRKAANLHTGGTNHDVTGQVHPQLVQAAEAVARAIEIPVVGVDFIVTKPEEPEYVFIEANERPGLANHEPQPTGERFIDLLFPLSMPEPQSRTRKLP